MTGHDTGIIGHDHRNTHRGGALRPRTHFETLVQEVLATELKATADTSRQFKWASNLGVIVAELFENTDMHAMTNLDGARFSTNALRRMVPHLETGLSSTEAQDLAYPTRRIARAAVDRVPPLEETIPGLRNPIVVRALSEVRKVVNELIARFGKPDLIRIELARDVKQGRKARDVIAKRNSDQAKRREDAKRRILEAIPGMRVSGSDIQKCLLADECTWTCPYTGRSFNMRDLFGDTPTVDVEHIIPFSRSFDDSFLNKTLCVADENRHGKRNRTPFEAYGHDHGRFQSMLERVKRFAQPFAARRSKLDRFRAEIQEEWDEGEFVSRQLVDTAYAARLAAVLHNEAWVRLRIARCDGHVDDGDEPAAREEAGGANVCPRARRAPQRRWSPHRSSSTSRAHKWCRMTSLMSPSTAHAGM